MYRIRPWLYTGKAAITEDRKVLAEHKINAMLQVHRPVEQAGIPSLYLLVEDGHTIAMSTFQQGVDFVKGHHENNHTVLIACGAGISRSSTFATACLHVIEGLTITDAFWQVRAANPKAMPDQIHWAALAKFAGDDTDFWDLWRDAEM